MLELYFKIDHDHYTIMQHCNNKTQYRSNYSPLLDPSRLGPIISHPCPCHKASLHVSCKKVKCSRYRSSLAQRLGRGLALLFMTTALEVGEWSAARPGRTLPPGKNRYHFTGAWVGPGPVWTGGISHPHRDLIPDRPARSQSLYRLSYRAHTCIICYI